MEASLSPIKENNHTGPPVENKLDSFLMESEMSYISKEMAHMVTLVNIVIISSVLTLFGMATNIVNMIIFSRQGFQDSVNISLCALALSDFLSLLTLFWISICYNPLFTNADISILSLEVEIVTGGIPHVIAINATGWLTVLVTLERCICIAFPLKVKDILTPFRMKVIVLVIFFMVTVCQIPTFYTTRLGWKFDAMRNRTVLGVVFLEDAQLINDITYNVVNVLGPISTFTIVSICTVILIVKLQNKSKWRQTAKATTNKDLSSAKDRKVVKMVVTVAIIFIASFTPNVIIFFIMARIPEFKIAGKYHNNFMVALDFALLVEAMNGSVNIFVYYNMSSKYKLHFRSLFFGEKMIS